MPEDIDDETPRLEQPAPERDFDDSNTKYIAAIGAIYSEAAMLAGEMMMSQVDPEEIEVKVLTHDFDS